MARPNTMPPIPVEIPENELSIVKIGGYKTRKLFLKSSKKKKYLIVYGHHSNIERIYSLAVYLNKYGSVTAVDLPGHAGISMKWQNPNFNNYADYLKKCITGLYQEKDSVNIVTMSYGFIIVTTMLQICPDLQQRISKVISLGSFTSDKQLNFSPLRKNVFRILCWLFSRNTISWLIEKLIIKNNKRLRQIIEFSMRRSPKTKGAGKSEFNKIVDMEMNLWSQSDFKTHYKTTLKMLKFSLPNKKISTSLVNLYSENDQYIVPKKSISAIDTIYQNAVHLPVGLSSHAPSLVASSKEIDDFMPDELIGFL
ncbi:hypothetical protein DYH10_02825 [Candidatus Saccharibacteria bacterium CPR2]|nr:hypothetical protein [Candidatus Saccharibacteria bacterium CPR2]